MWLIQAAWRSMGRCSLSGRILPLAVSSGRRIRRWRRGRGSHRSWLISALQLDPPSSALASIPRILQLTFMLHEATAWLFLHSRPPGSAACLAAAGLSPVRAPTRSIPCRALCTTRSRSPVRSSLRRWFASALPLWRSARAERGSARGRGPPPRGGSYARSARSAAPHARPEPIADPSGTRSPRGRRTTRPIVLTNSLTD